MTSAERVRPWLLGSLLCAPLSTGGCAVDLLVGGAETGTTGEAETATPEDSGTTEVPMPTTEAPAESSTGPDVPGTTGDSGGEESTTREGSTSTGEMVEGSTGEISCEGLSFGDCTELPHCLWYGEPKIGECALSPCEQPKHECWEAPFESCVDFPPCAWVGEPEMGECGPLECVPCEVLNVEECVETPTCFYEEMEMACLEV